MSKGRKGCSQEQTGQRQGEYIGRDLARIRKKGSNSREDMPHQALQRIGGLDTIPVFVII